MRIRLRYWRLKRGLSLRELAQRAQIAHLSIIRIEHGRANPSVELLAKLARALEVHITDLFPKPRRRR